MIESLITIGGALGFEDQVTAITSAVVSILLALSGFAAALVKLIESVADVTPLDAKSPYLSKTKKVIAKVDGVLDKIALNPRR